MSSHTLPAFLILDLPSALPHRRRCDIRGFVAPLLLAMLAGACMSGDGDDTLTTDARACPSDGNSCTRETQRRGKCVSVPLADGATCDMGGTCQAGACVLDDGGGVPPDGGAPSTGKPGPDNTGVPAGTVLTAYSGPSSITVDGTVIDGMQISGGLEIYADNVTVRRSELSFERCFITEIPGYVARYVRGIAELDELKQTLRVRLLVAGPAAAPQLASYRGRGPLGAWLRVVAVRAALDQVRRRPRDHTSNNSAPAPADAELALLKAQYAPAFQRAFAATLAALPGRERTMLRLHFVDGMTLTAIARSFQVNASTVHRAIDRARTRVLSETLAFLANDLGVGVTQADSIARLVQSRLDLDLRRCLATEPA